MYSALNRPAEAGTAIRVGDPIRNDAQPITPAAPEPVRRVAMRQTWRRLSFLHWAYDPSLVRQLLPPELELDIFDGAAYVGLVPFEIHNLRGIPHFPETNVRTYVIGPDGSRAVWFFSLDAGRLVAVIGARAIYHLPYFWASMQVNSRADAVHYRSRRIWPHSALDFSDITVEPAAPLEVTARDHFFTARYRLYSRIRGRLAYAQIEHAPWPLTAATVLQLDQNLIQASGLPAPQGAPISHYATELDVKIGYIRVC
jgi:uncharacterized protein YqjF (DUF2071 family)